MSDIYNKKILIVDDEPTNILLLTKILESKGFVNIVTTLNPCETFELHRKNNFELVLLDINMPEMDGYEVLDKLRGMDNFNTTKVVATSGDVSQRDIQKALAAGFVNYITKPMKMDSLLEIVGNVLQESERL